MKTRSTSRPDSGEERRSAATVHNAARLRRAPAAAMADARASSLAQLQQQRMASSSSQAAQLKARAEMMAGGGADAPVQRREGEELLQGKFAAAQRVEDEELLQGKFDTVQREEDEELLQGKFAIVQRAEDEELLQGKFAPVQRMDEEELLQGKFDALQRRDTETPLQGRFEQSSASVAPAAAPVQREEKPNNTGLPNQLKSGIESLSGMNMDHVKVHYNSDKPAQLQAHAYAQGSEIHVAPGQEQHLPHEAWHVVQQAQGRVRPTVQMEGGVAVNDDVGLEGEADLMGDKAATLTSPGSALIDGGSLPVQAGFLRAVSQRVTLQIALSRRSENALQLVSKKNRRKERKREKGISYKEKHEQRHMDTLVGSNVRQQLDLANPLRSDEARRTDVRRLSSMEDEDRTAWSKSLHANMHLQPEGYVPTLIQAPGQEYNGLTTFNDQQKEVQVRYDPDEFSYRDKDRRIGRLAATFTHELAVHGPNLHGDPDPEHGDMSSPETRDHYLNSIHRTFSGLDNAKQQRAFANEWKTDIFNHLAWDDDLDRPTKKERRQWAIEEHRKMIQAIDHPNKFDWA